MLAMVLVQGEQTGGSSRWLKIEGVSFQPSEMSKLCCLLLCSHGLVGKRIWQTRFGSFMSKLIKVGFILVMIMLVLRQPDFGTSALLVLVSLAMLFIRGFRLRHMGIVSLMAFTTMLAIMFCKPYRVKRLISFFDPWSDTRASGYQLSRSIISIGSGGLSGVGLGESSQKLLHLPQSHTDFIYSIIGEEMGFLGLMALNLGFITFIISGSAISLGLTETYLKVLCTGVVIMIGLQALMHISVCLGLVPTKGITLPFISYGGSSTVISMAMSGILIGAAGRRRN
jgi:cell division protein FtsW